MILLLFVHFPVEDIYSTIKYPASKLKAILCAGVRGYYFCVATLTNELGEVGLVTESRLPRPLVTRTLLPGLWGPLSLFSPPARCHNLTCLTDCNCGDPGAGNMPHFGKVATETPLWTFQLERFPISNSNDGHYKSSLIIQSNFHIRERKLSREVETFY